MATEVSIDWRGLIGKLLKWAGEIVSMFTGAFVGVAIAEPLRLAFEPLFRKFQYEKNEANPNLIPSPDDLIQIFLHRQLSEDDTRSYLKKWGYDENWSQKLIDISYRWPEVGYIFEMWNRGIINDDTALYYLRQLGFNDETIERIAPLRFYVPSATDMVRFAVREAFTPQAAEAMGYYEDIPPEFIIEAQKAGLSEHYARMYWAAHWQLPSVEQVFEMMHRGVEMPISVDDYLKIADYAPKWRDPLKAISYNVITRVDIRRMRKLGVVGPEKVEQVYRHLGYTPEDAKLLAEYVERSTVEEERETTKQEILSAYRVGMINDILATKMLKELGYSDEQAYFLISLADYQRHSDEINATISAVRKAYMAGEYTYSQAVAELSRIGVRYDEIQNLIRAWDISKLAEKEYPTKNDIIRWFRYGIMSFEEAYQRLARMGYEPRDIQLLLYDSLTYPSKSDIISLYRQGIIPYEKAYGLLRALGYPDEACEWFLADRPEIPTKAELIRFLRKGIIDLDTFVYLMRRSGYPDEAIGWYIEDIEPKLTKAECDRYLMDGVLSVEGYVRFLRKMGYTDEEITLSIEDIIKRLEAKGKKQQKQQEQQEGGE
jgi:hypothetical protein